MDTTRWLAVSDALAKVRQPMDALTLADRKRISGWITDGRVKLRFLEAVTFIPDQVSDSEPIVMHPDGNGVVPLGAAVAVWDLPLKKSVAYLEIAEESDIQMLRDYGVLDPQADWWTTGEIRLPPSHNGHGPRATFYGVQLNEDELDRCMAVAGIAVTGAVRLMSNDDVEDWCASWLASGKKGGVNSAWDDFKALPASAGLSRDDVLKPAYIKAKARISP